MLMRELRPHISEGKLLPVIKTKTYGKTLDCIFKTNFLEKKEENNLDDSDSYYQTGWRLHRTANQTKEIPVVQKII